MSTEKTANSFVTHAIGFAGIYILDLRRPPTTNTKVLFVNWRDGL